MDSGVVWYESNKNVPPDFYDVIGLIFSGNKWRLEEVYIWKFGWSNSCSSDLLSKSDRVVAWTWKPSLPEPPKEILKKYENN